MSDSKEILDGYIKELANSIIGGAVVGANAENPESFSTHAQDFGKELGAIRKLIDPNDDRVLSDGEIVAMISDPKRVGEIMKGLDVEQKAVFADAISGIRAGLGAACATLPHTTIDETLSKAEQNINSGLAALRTHADKKTAGVATNETLAATGNEERLTLQGQQNANTLATVLADELPVSIDLPSAAKSCRAVGTTENPALGYLSPDSPFRVPAPGLSGTSK